MPAFRCKLLGQWIDPEPLYLNNLNFICFPDVPRLQLYFDDLPVGSPQPITTLNTVASFQFIPANWRSCLLG